MNNPLSHVGQTARPEDQASNATEGTLDQQPRTKPEDTRVAAPKAGPQPAAKSSIGTLKPGEAPPESSAGS